MMNKKQWIVFLCIFVCYLLLGAFVFYIIESKEEIQRNLDELHQKLEIDGLIRDKFPVEEQHDLFIKITDYCNKPVGDALPQYSKGTKLTWNFYHSIFFVLTVLSTIGYGNLSPTTPFTRAFMMIYGIVGIPINGIVIITLGDYFGTTFTNIYKRWRKKRSKRAYATLGLVGKIVLSSLPGLALLILIPSTFIYLYEGWTFEKAVEFAFGTLTTIGTGQFVPGTIQQTDSTFLFVIYKAFLLIWIIVGLGYLAMVFSFITRGLQSKKMTELEQQLTKNIKKTNKKIRKELRYFLNDYIFTHSYATPVYRERRLNVVTYNRTHSCPDLRIDNDVQYQVRKRAVSVLPRMQSTLECKGKSDTDLQSIDKIKTFESNISSQQNKLLLKVANALANYNESIDSDTTTSSLETNSSFDIASSYDDWKDIDYENMNSDFIVEVKNPDITMCKKTKARLEQEFRETEKYGKARSRTLLPAEEPQSLFAKIKRRIRQSLAGEKPNIDVENQNSLASNNFMNKPLAMEDNIHPVDDHSLSDFLRALSIINFNEITKKRKTFGSEESQSDVKSRRRLPIIPLLRRNSLISSASSSTAQRRLSENACNAKSETAKQYPCRFSKYNTILGLPTAFRRKSKPNISNDPDQNSEEVPSISRVCSTDEHI